MKEKILSIVTILMLVIICISVGYQQIQYTRIIKMLTTMSSQDISAYRVYARGNPIEFKIQDPMIDEFFQSLVGNKSYSPSHDTILREDHEWVIEIVTKKDVIRIACYIPFGEGNIVVGDLGEFRQQGGGALYGYFRSRLLFLWYQTYSHRWLEPEARPGAAGE